MKSLASLTEGELDHLQVAIDRQRFIGVGVLELLSDAEVSRRIRNEPPGYISEERRTALGLVMPRPKWAGGSDLDGGDACWMCWGSGEGDATGPETEGACTRCRGYSVEPRPLYGMMRWVYGGAGDDFRLVGPKFSTDEPPPTDKDWTP